jgi:hypothetical protein
MHAPVLYAHECFLYKRVFLCVIWEQWMHAYIGMTIIGLGIQ